MKKTILQRIPSSVWDWSATIRAGFISGLVALFLMLLLPWIILGDPFFIMRLIASLLLGPAVISPAGSLVPAVYLVALLVHFSLSMIYAVLIALIFHRWGMAVAFVGGAVFGFVIYILNFYLFSIFFPWLLPYRNWMLMVANIVFGALAGALYELLENAAIIDEPFLNKQSEERI